MRSILQPVFYCLALLSVLVTSTNTTGSDFSTRQPMQSGLWVVEAPPARFISDHPLPQAKALHKDLVRLSARLQKDLGVAPLKNPVRIYVFQNLENYQRAVLKAIPYLKKEDVQRSGIFLWRNNTPYVFLVHDKSFPRTLRHEFTHVMLNVHFGEIPIWVDEGLALYYETGGAVGWNPEMAEELTTQLARGWVPNLQQLEKRKNMQDLDYLSYAESWGWTYLLLSRTAKGNLHMADYLNRVKRSRKTIKLTESLGRVRGHLNDEWSRVFQRRGQTATTPATNRPTTTTVLPRRRKLLPALFTNPFKRNRRSIFAGNR